jgi:hypothetical protein
MMYSRHTHSDFDHLLRRDRPWQKKSNSPQQELVTTSHTRKSANFGFFASLFLGQLHKLADDQLGRVASLRNLQDVSLYETD